MHNLSRYSLLNRLIDKIRYPYNYLAADKNEQFYNKGQPEETHKDNIDKTGEQNEKDVLSETYVFFHISRIDEYEYCRAVADYSEGERGYPVKHLAECPRSFFASADNGNGNEDGKTADNNRYVQQFNFYIKLSAKISQIEQQSEAGKNSPYKIPEVIFITPEVAERLINRVD